MTMIEDVMTDTSTAAGEETMTMIEDVMPDPYAGMLTLFRSAFAHVAAAMPAHAVDVGPPTRLQMVRRACIEQVAQIDESGEISDPRECVRRADTFVAAYQRLRFRVPLCVS